MDTSTIIGLLLAVGGAVAFMQSNKGNKPSPQESPAEIPAPAGKPAGKPAASRDQAMKALDTLSGYFEGDLEASQALQSLAKQLFAPKVP